MDGGGTTVYTSIQISPETRKRLAHLKATSHETYDEVLNKLIALLPEGDDEGKYTDEFRIGLLTARLQIKGGQTIGHEEVKKSLGV